MNVEQIDASALEILIYQEGNYSIRPKGPGDAHIVIDGALTLGKKLTTALPLFFKSCVFRETLVLENIELPPSVGFINCTFEKGARFVNLGNSTKFQTKVVFEDCSGRNLHFENIEVGLFNLDRKNSFELIELDRCTIIDQFSCEGEKISHLSIDKLTVGDFVIGEIEKPALVTMSECTAKRLLLHKANLTTLSLYEIRAAYLGIDNCTLGSFYFTNVESNMNLRKSKFADECFIKSDTGHGNYKSGGKLSIQNCRFERPLLCDQGSVFHNVEIDCSTPNTGTMLFKDCEIKNLSFSGTNSSADISHTRITLGNLWFSHFTNRASLSFSGCKVSSNASLYIGGSDLGQTRFLEHDFSRYTNIKIQHSFLSEIKFASCKWFLFSRLDTEAEDKYNSRREIFRQLKQAAEKQSDRIQALEFQAEELRQHELELKNTKPCYSRDRLILWLSRSNRFGLDWVLPVGWLILVTILFFIPIGICASPELNSSVAESWEDVGFTIKTLFCDRLKILIQLFNPAHNPLGMLDKNQASAAFLFFDGVHRIIAAFFIVQIITAFRKYAKS